MKKDVYEISVWEDQLIAETIKDGIAIPEHYEEQKIAIIGSDTMTAPFRALEPKLVQNVNGVDTLTFKMYYTYIDVETGARESNPFVKLLVNERRIKCKWKNKWYDLVIKAIQEDSNGKAITYTCKNLFINELSKTGFNLVFDNELENNQGTAQELGEKILEGTDWSVATEGQDVIQQTIEESLYELKVTAGFIGKDSSGATDISIAKDKKILVPYSVFQKPYPTLFQFFYTEDGKYEKYQENNTVHLVGIDCCFAEGLSITEEIDGSLSIFIGATQIATLGATQGLTKWRADRLVRAPLQEYSALVDRYCYVYKDASGKKIYKYITTEYNDPTVVLNLVVNSKEFKDTTGWIGEGLSWQLYPPYTNITNLESYQATTYLGLTANKTVFNTGLQKSSMYIEDGFQKGEKYIFRVKGYKTLGGDKIISGITPRICTRDDNYNIPENPTDYFTIGGAVVNGNWIEYELTCSTSIPRAKITTTKMGLFITASQDCWIEEFQFFKKILDSNGSRINPGEMDKQSVATEVYAYFDADTSVLDPKDIEYLWKSTEDWTTGAPTAQYPVDAQGHYTYEKIRSISGKNSNRFNLLQSVAETFECWVRFVIEHDSTGKTIYDKGIPRKKVYFKKDIGEEVGYGFVYGIDLKSISRSINSDQITSKVIVIPNTNQYAENGVCEIAQSQYNPCNENFIINFDYYINQGLLDSGTVNKDLWLSSAHGGLGYYPTLKEKNTEYYKLTEENTARKMEYDKQNSMLQLYEQYYTSTLEEITSVKSDMARLAGLPSYDENAIIDYIAEHPNYDKLETLFVTLKTLEEEVKSYYAIKTSLQSSVDALQITIENNSKRQVELLTDINELHKKFYSKYSRFLQEGSWTSQNYLDENLYYLDAQSVAYTSSRPQISYNISVLRLSALEEFKGKNFSIGDITYIEDTEFFGYTYTSSENGTYRVPYREKSLISEITSNFDSPEKDSFKVQNYKTQFEDLFQRITATTQSLQYSSGEYQRAADALNTNGTINEETLQSSIERNANLVYNSQNNTIVRDATGITLIDNTNPSQQTKITAGGLFITTDGGVTWKNAVRGEGIATQYLTSGSINTGVITILDGANPSFRWNNLGINAYVKKYDETTKALLGYSANNFVRFDQFGIYGLNGFPDGYDKKEYEPTSEEEIWNDAKFGLTWKGFFLKNKYGAGAVEISSEKDIVVNDGANDRIRIGNLGTVENPIFGIRISDSTGSAVMETIDNGTLWLKKALNIQTSDTGLSVAIGRLTGYKTSDDDSKIYEVINANNKFIVYEDGTMRATEGSFNGEINATSGFFRGTIEATSGILGGSEGSVIINDKGLLVAGGGFEIRDENDNPVLSINSETQKFEFSGTLKGADGEFSGTLSGANGSFSGEITAESGIIGGFSIRENSLISTDTAQSIQLLGKEGKIIANIIELGTGATITDYLALGNKVKLCNPVKDSEGRFLQVFDEEKTYISIDENALMKLGTLKFDGKNSTIEGLNWSIAPSLATFANITAQGGTIENVVFRSSSVQTAGGQMIFKPSAHGKGDGFTFTFDAGQSFSPTVGDYYLVRGANFSKELIATAVSENGIVTFSTDVTGADSITKLAHIEGNQITDQLLIGINPDAITGGSSQDSVTHLYQSGFSFIEPILQEDGKLNYKISPKLFLGNLSAIGKTGFGLYGENVYLKGTLTTQVGENSYAGVNTIDGVISSLFGTTERIVFWAGASSEEAESIKASPFQVTDAGNIYARDGRFEGSIITNSEIQGADIYASRLHGSGDNPSLCIYDAKKGISFRTEKILAANDIPEIPEKEIFSIGQSGFVSNNESFISIKDDQIDFSGNNAIMDVFQTRAASGLLRLKELSLRKGYSSAGEMIEEKTSIDFVNENETEKLTFSFKSKDGWLRAATFTADETILSKKTTMKENVIFGEVTGTYIEHKKVEGGYDIYVYESSDTLENSSIVDTAIADKAIVG